MQNISKKLLPAMYYQGDFAQGQRKLPGFIVVGTFASDSSVAVPSNP